MNFRAWAVVTGIAMAASTFLGVAPAQAQEEKAYGWKDGMWRLELSAWTSIYSGHRSRSGDYGFAGSVAYEVPVSKRFSVGLKMYPLLGYDQDDSGEDTIWGVGFGPEFRFYTKPHLHRGFFFEVGTAVIAHSGKFDGNSGNINFLNEGGAGYKFKTNWHVAAKIRHLSNAGFAQSNSGVNSLGLAFGYTFRPGIG